MKLAWRGEGEDRITINQESLVIMSICEVALKKGGVALHPNYGCLDTSI